MAEPGRTATAFSIDQARQALPPLDLDVRAPARGALADYCHFFGFDAIAEAGVRHDLGWVEAWGYQLSLIHI